MNFLNGMIYKSTDMFLSMAENLAKKVAHSLRNSFTELVPIISRHECIDNCGMPTSMTRMPKLALVMGPIVEPQAESLRTITS